MHRYLFLLALLTATACGPKHQDTTPQKACQDGDLDVCLGHQRCVGERQCVQGEWSACECEAPTPQAGMGGAPTAPQGGTGEPQGGTGGSLSPIGGMMAPNPLPQGGAGGSNPPTCPTGFQLRQGTCQDIDECLVNNGGCGALDCVNEPGAFSCAAPDATWRNVEVQTAEVAPAALVQTQSVTCRVTFHNNGQSPYVVPRLVITLREPNEANFGGKGTDILTLTNVTLPANDGMTYSPTFEFRTDRPAGTWRCYGTHQDNAQGWHDGVSANVAVSRLADVQSSMGTIVNTAGWQSVAPGETVQALVSFTNPNTIPVAIRGVGTGRQAPEQHKSGPAYDMTPEVITTLEPGQTVQRTMSLTIPTSGITNRPWEWYPTWQDKYGAWHDGVSQYFQVRPNDESGWGSISTFTVSAAGPELFAPWSCYDDTDPNHVRCTEWVTTAGYGVPQYTEPTCVVGRMLSHACPTNQMLMWEYGGKQSGPTFSILFEYAGTSTVAGQVRAYYTENPAYATRKDGGWLGR